MAKLYFRYAAMGAGKSIDVLKVAYNYEERGQKVLLYTSGLDNRFGEGVIATRIGIKREAILYNRDYNFFEYVKNHPVDCVLIDEAQFLTKDQVYQLSHIVDVLNIPVICYGLRSDFQMNLFEGSQYLFALADTIEELKTICWCGKKAICNTRLLDGKPVYEGEQVFIGGNESYIALCRKHYKQGKTK